MATPRNCLVTGAGRGIGAAVARALADAGHRVALTARSADQLQSVAATLPVPTLTIPADITDPAAADEIFGTVERTWGPVEILVANAGHGRSAPLVRTGDDIWQQMIDLNLTAPFRCVRRAVPAMTAAGWGRIVVVASVAALTGMPYIAAYTAAKHGVLGLVRSAAAELATKGVTVNAVCPGYVDTPMTTTSSELISEKTGRSADQVTAELAAMQGHGRLITPEEVASAVRFCVDNGSVSGQAITVDGGPA